MKYLFLLLLGLMCFTCEEPSGKDNSRTESSSDNCGCNEYYEDQIIPNYPAEGFVGRIKFHEPDSDCDLYLIIYGSLNEYSDYIHCSAIDKFINQQSLNEY